jgi:heme-degrading monooxygenase HmoA
LTVAVQRAVLVEFDRYVQAGDLTKTIERLEALQKASDESGGFVGMYL